MTAEPVGPELLERVARRVLDGLPRLTTPAWVRIELAGVMVMIVVAPPATTTARPPSGVLRLTDCQRDVLEVLRSANQRLTRHRIIAALDAAGRVHGESTVALALKDLGERGLIDMPRPRSRDGYAIAATGEHS